VAITGTPRIFSRRFPWVGFPRVTVTIGAPFLAHMPGGTAQREQDTAEIMVRIALLLPPDLRGCYADRVAHYALTSTQ
jgi:hypothetical protein